MDLVTAGAVFGDFSNMTANAEFTDAGGNRIFFGNDGSSIFLQAVPEPATVVLWSMMAAGLAVFSYRRRRQK